MIISSGKLYSLVYVFLSSKIDGDAFSIRSRTHRQHFTRMQSATDNEAGMPTLTKLSGISSPEILKHDTFLLDMWGVMHDGQQPYEGVLETVRELKSQGKRLIILSNSSKKRDDSEKMLRKREFALIV
jgi:FMN phosphatase YigB (HAD superfamily)